MEHTNESVEWRDGLGGGEDKWKWGVERWWSIQMEVGSGEMVEHTNESGECSDGLGGGAYKWKCGV